MRERMEQRVEYYIKKLQNKQEYADIINRCKAVSIDEKVYAVGFLPILTEYIKWVLINASRAGKKRLYFLARDGYQMYILAKTLSDKWNLGIECRYLNVSRYAIRVPEYHLLGDRCLEYICSGGIDVTFEKVMKRAALTDEEAMSIAGLCNREVTYKNILNYSQVMELKTELSKIPEFMEYVTAHSKDVYDNTVGYLEQEGLMDEIPYSLVDSGWVGTLQKSIEHLVKSVNPMVEITGYYFGMYEYPKDIDKEKYNAFYFSPEKGMKNKVYFSNCLFEAVFTSPEGMTVGYTQAKEGYIPLYDLTRNPNQETIDRYVSLLYNFLDSYTEGFPSDYCYKKSLRMVKSIAYKMMGSPEYEESEAFGGLLFCDDLLEKSLQMVAAKLEYADIRNLRAIPRIMIIKGLKSGVIRDSAWIEGTIVRNARHVGFNLWHAHMYKYLVYLRKRLR